MVTVDAGEMARGHHATGRVALYGIYFDFNKADVKPESDTTLAEIAKLLKTSPAMSLLVVGHTDNVGSFDFNLDLSQRRAAAVVDALTGRFERQPRPAQAVRSLVRQSRPHPTRARRGGPRTAGWSWWRTLDARPAKSGWTAEEPSRAQRGRSGHTASGSPAAVDPAPGCRR